MYVCITVCAGACYCGELACVCVTVCGGCVFVHASVSVYMHVAVPLSFWVPNLIFCSRCPTSHPHFLLVSGYLVGVD